jgi:hypothetical protein
VGNGNEIGLFRDTACPANDFTVASAQQQTLTSQCGGCTCSVKTSCATTLYPYGTVDCSGQAPLFTLSIVGTTDPGPGPCTSGWVETLHLNPNYLKLSAFTAASGTCVSGGAAADQSTWGATKNFCGAARQSSTCGNASQVCVAKPPGAAPTCVRVPSAGASCPAGYPNAQGTWYSGHSPAQCSCSACTKSSDGTCPTAELTSGVLFSNAFDCSDNGGQIQNSEPFPACVGRNVTTNSWGEFHSVRFAGPITPDAPGTCTRPTNTDSPATPDGPSTICCQ